MLQKINIVQNLAYKAYNSYKEYEEATSHVGDIIYFKDMAKLYIDMGGNGVLTEICNNIDTKPAIQKKEPLICNQCGAPLNPHKNQCEYCRTYYN